MGAMETVALEEVIVAVAGVIVEIAVAGVKVEVVIVAIASRAVVTVKGVLGGLTV